MSESPEPPEAHGPAELFLDVFLFAPIGLVMDFPRVAPELLGEPRVAFAHACREGHRRVDATNELVHHTLERRVQQAQRAMEGLGISVDLPSWLPAPGRVRSAAAPAEAGRVGGGAPSDLAAVAAAEHGDEAPAPAVAVPGPGDAADDPAGPAPVVDPGPNGHELAIPDYESLSASQVMPRLESLAPEELEAVRLFENHNRGRKTILNKIAQLQGG